MYEHKGIAEGLAAFGRGGDSMLMHVHPAEVEALNSMAPGSITINPDTGMPEAFFWLIPTLLQTVVGGIGSAASAGLGAVGLGGLSPAITGTLGTLGGTSGLAGAMGSAGAALGAPAGVTAKLGSMGAAGSLGTGAPIAAPTSAAASQVAPGFTATGGISGPSAITQALPKIAPNVASAVPKAASASGIGSGSGLSAIKAATTPSSLGLGSPAAAKGGMAAIKAATAPISQSLAPVKGGLSSIKAATTPASIGGQLPATSPITQKLPSVVSGAKDTASAMNAFQSGTGDALNQGIRAALNKPATGYNNNWLGDSLMKAGGWAKNNPMETIMLGYGLDMATQEPGKAPAWAQRGKGKNNIWDPDYEFQVLRDPVWGPEIAGGWLPHGPDDPLATTMGGYGGFSPPFSAYGYYG